ncbi:Arsenite efflux pump ArsB, ACR3 family [Marinospirillum celere]|uniref:Arsenite efflux pump ArsB, ACR3 family n=1 Tax=Marinospirillum celere TaxID=1122252 RepID=A0A1I1GLH4_9GAMM|nr:bile acid:sodium symporter [Marinospirillum celere]SFC12617.1 Arsenite efflux pump ArsB, ACR3 family [Marinospirillum celere]
MQRISLERHQVWIYLTAIGCGLLLGQQQPALSHLAEPLLWPALILLLYTTFVQVPLLHLRAAFHDRRFMLAALLGNFLLLPLLVWLLIQWLPDNPILRLGVLLVLLMPCTDWFITFTQLGKGSSAHALALAPILLLLQLLLLPVYIWLLGDLDQSLSGLGQQLLPALLVILLPLLLAAITERWMEKQPQRLVWREHLGWGPVPLLAGVIFLVASIQASEVLEVIQLLPHLVPVFIAFLLLAPLLAKALTNLLRLPQAQGRTLAFSFGTRNSFVVLPLALALPAGWELVALVVVLQSLIELLGMIVYLWWMPRLLTQK